MKQTVLFILITLATVSLAADPNTVDPNAPVDANEPKPRLVKPTVSPPLKDYAFVRFGDVAIVLTVDDIGVMTPDQIQRFVNLSIFFNLYNTTSAKFKASLAQKMIGDTGIYNKAMSQAHQRRLNVQKAKK